MPDAIKAQYVRPPPLMIKPKQLPDMSLLAGTSEGRALTQAEQDQVSYSCSQVYNQLTLQMDLLKCI